MFCCLKTQQLEKQEDDQNHDELHSNSDSDEASPKQRTPKKLLPEHIEGSSSSKTSRTEILTTDESSAVASDQVDAVQVGVVQVVVGNDKEVTSSSEDHPPIDETPTDKELTSSSEEPPPIDETSTPATPTVPVLPEPTKLGVANLNISEVLHFLPPDEDEAFHAIEGTPYFLHCQWIACLPDERIIFSQEGEQLVDDLGIYSFESLDDPESQLIGRPW
jgi:hypothetical protein|tara:strand:- start:28 stop:684 length:657 start_codon:yes stop_codon:yes gene_type:complete